LLLRISSFWRYLLAILAVGAAFAGRWLLVPYLGVNTPYVMVYPVAAVVAATMGAAVGCVALLVGMILSETWLVAPIGVLEFNWSLALRAGVFFAGIMCLGMLGTRLRHTRRTATLEAESARRAEDALRDNERRLRSLFQNMSEGFALGEALYRPDGTPYDFRFLEVNPAFERQSGLGPEAVGRPMRQVLPHLEQFWIDTYCGVATKGQPARFEHYNRDTNRYYEVTCYSPSKGRFAIIFSDISARRHAEQARLRATRIQQAILDHTHMLVACLDANFNFMLVNQAYAAADSKKPEDFVGKNHFDLFPNEENEVIFRQVVSTGQPHFERAKPFEYVHAPQRGVSYWDWSLTPIVDDQGRVELLVLTLADVTVLKTTQQALELAKEKAEHASAAKDQFIAALSHELRTPLTPVVAAVSALGDDPALDEDTRLDLAMIRRNLDLEVRLIDDLLDVSRVAAGKLRLELRLVDAASVLREAATIVSSDLDAHSQTLSIDTPGAPYPVQADAARLQQVFWNLLRNAIKFSPPGGRIQVRGHLGSGPEQPRLLSISVSDQGQGIDPAMLPRLFRAFEQGQRAGSFGGLGLGLAISKGIIELHGGSISAASDGVGKGAIFTVTLPLAAATAEGRPPQIPANHKTTTSAGDSSQLAGVRPAGALRILLVEDHPDTAKLMGRLLKAEGFEVTKAASVGSALLAMETNHFDILMSDLGLPDGTGYDLLQQLRSRGKHIRAIALSGYGSVEHIRQSLASGFVEHLTKPVTFEAVRHALVRAAAMPASEGAPSNQAAKP
jgi:PAS domain S-box-containing protein